MTNETIVLLCICVVQLVVLGFLIWLACGLGKLVDHLKKTGDGMEADWKKIQSKMKVIGNKYDKEAQDNE